MRKLCLHNWKTSSLPDYSADVVFQSLPFRIIETAPVNVQAVDESSNKSYPCSPIKMSPENDLRTDNFETQITSMSATSKAKDLNYPMGPSRNNPKPDFYITKANLEETEGLRSINHSSDGSPFGMGINPDNNCSDNERTIALRQFQLSNAKIDRYESLISLLKRESGDHSSSSPSVPSSVFTTPERRPTNAGSPGSSINSVEDSVTSESSSYTLKSTGSNNKTVHRRILDREEKSKISSPFLSPNKRVVANKELTQNSEKEKDSFVQESSEDGSDDLIMNYVNEDSE